MRLIALVIVVLGITATAHAYPQFQLSLGTDRCTSCHFSPGGGGLLTDYGRDEAGSTISAGGDGRFLNGKWTPPPWFQLGVDLRGATGVKLRDAETEVLAFPMQADLYVRAGTSRWSLNLTAGARAAAREPRAPLVERLASREHYVMYQRDSGSYVRVGRFFPVHGVRSQDHTAYVRRYLGFHTLEEPYGVAAGWFGEEAEAHVSAFVPRPVDFLGSGLRERGVAAYYERRFLDDAAALAAQARLGVSSTTTRVSAGVVGKRWLPSAELMILAEIDLVRQAFADDAGPTRYQLAGYAGASKMVARGWMLGGAVHRWHPDVRTRTARDALQLDLQYFPRAHFELHLLTRVSATGHYDEPGLLTFLQLHYYL